LAAARSQPDLTQIELRRFPFDAQQLEIKEDLAYATGKASAK
jgi:hypothetical protein